MSEDKPPCPFCDGDALTARMIDGTYVIGCADPDCRGFCGSGPRYATEDDAAQAWSRREGGDRMMKISEYERCRDCVHATPVTDEVFGGVTHTCHKARRNGVTYAVARSVDTKKLCEWYKPRGFDA